MRSILVVLVGLDTVNPGACADSAAEHDARIVDEWRRLCHVHAGEPAQKDMAPPFEERAHHRRARTIPLFTGNWLKKKGTPSLPAPFGRYDLAAPAVGAATLAAWATLDDESIPRSMLGALLLLAGVLHLGRQLRWQPHTTGAEPLVAVLHVAYAFVPAGFILAGCAVLLGSASHATAAIHA